MPKIAIVTDTDTSLSEEVAAQHGIRQVPIVVVFGEESLDVGQDINDKSAFARIDAEGKSPTTSAPSPGKFAEAFKAAFNEGADSVICFTVSGEVSATFSSATNAAEMIDGDVTVVDTKSITLGQGFMVMAAAQAAAAGKSKEEVIAVAENTRNRTHLFAALATLKYLAMSGRVGHLAAGIAGMLSIKPILTIRDGKLDLLERVRTRKKSWGRVFELTKEALGDKKIEQIAIVHVDALDDAKEFEKRLRVAVPSCPDEIMVTELNPGMSIHTGRGMVGVSFVTE
jgi:DegV family protein with EDD domain